MWHIKEHAWPVSLTVVVCSAFWFFRDNSGVPWYGLLSDRSMLLLGFFGLIYTICCTLELWLGPKKLLRNHRWIEGVARDAQARLAAVEERERAADARERRSSLLEAPETARERVLVEYQAVQDDLEPAAPMVMPVPAQAERPATKVGWRPTFIHVAVGICLGLLGDIALIVYMTRQVYPDLSYTLAFWTMMGNAFDTGLFIRLLLLGFITLILMIYYPKFNNKLKKAAQKAAEIEGEAQGILDSAKDEVLKIVADARREGSEIKKAAIGEAADIRVQAKEEAAQILDEARQKAEGVISQAKNKSQEIMNDLWLLMRAKGEDMGISDQDLQGLVTVLQAARTEAATVREQAQAEADKAADAIIAQARQEAEAQATQILHRARVQAADVLLGRGEERDSGAPAGQDGQADNDLGQVTDQVQPPEPPAGPEIARAEVDDQQRIELSPRQAVALNHIHGYGSLTIQDYETLCPDVNRRTLQRDLRVLVDIGLLTTEGAGNQLIYRHNGAIATSATSCDRGSSRGS